MGPVRSMFKLEGEAKVDGNPAKFLITSSVVIITISTSSSLTLTFTTIWPQPVSPVQQIVTICPTFAHETCPVNHNIFAVVVIILQFVVHNMIKQ